MDMWISGYVDVFCTVFSVYRVPSSGDMGYGLSQAPMCRWVPRK